MKTLSNESIDRISKIRELANDKKKIVFVSGNFNIVHPGHVRLLRFASECGDFVVVGVLDKNSKGTLLSEENRLEGIQSLQNVDYSFILHDSPSDFIRELKPDVVVKGKEYELVDNPEFDILKSYGGELLFGSGDISFSSLDLLKREFLDINLSTIKKPMEFPKRHNFNIGNYAAIIDKFKSLNICVIGDLIIDEYITCDPVGMSQEDPTIVVTPVLSQKFIGGAGIVASHAQSLGASVFFFSITGKDDTADFAKLKLHEYGVKSHLYEDKSRPTILKQRFKANGKTLLRVNHLRQHEISKQIQNNLTNDINQIINDIDLVIFADFNYGCLPQSTVDEIIKSCRKNDIMMVADSQSSSQIGDVSRFKGMELITPTEREARLAVRDFNSGLIIIADLLQKKSNSKNILMTLGKEGLIIHSNKGKTDEWITDRLPAFNELPQDSAGAGDSLLVCSAMALATGCDIWQSSYLGSIASACQVGRIGNVPLSDQDILRELAFKN